MPAHRQNQSDSLKTVRVYLSGLPCAIIRNSKHGSGENDPAWVASCEDWISTTIQNVGRDIPIPDQSIVPVNLHVELFVPKKFQDSANINGYIDSNEKMLEDEFLRVLTGKLPNSTQVLLDSGTAWIHVQPLSAELALSTLIGSLADPNPKVQTVSARAICQIGPPAVEATPRLMHMLASDEEHLWRSAEQAILSIGPGAIPYLVLTGFESVDGRIAEVAQVIYDRLPPKPPINNKQKIDQKLERQQFDSAAKSTKSDSFPSENNSLEVSVDRTSVEAMKAEDKKPESKEEPQKKWADEVRPPEPTPIANSQADEQIRRYVQVMLGPVVEQAAEVIKKGIERNQVSNSHEFTQAAGSPGQLLLEALQAKLPANEVAGVIRKSFKVDLAKFTETFNGWLKSQTAEDFQEKTRIVDLVRLVTHSLGIQLLHDSKPCSLSVARAPNRPNGRFVVIDSSSNYPIVSKTYLHDLPDLCFGVEPKLETFRGQNQSHKPNAAKG